MYNVDVAAVLQLIRTALLHAYRNIYVSVPAALEATEGDLADVVSIVGKCKSAPTQDELASLNRDFLTVRKNEATLETATKTATVLGPIIGLPLPEAEDLNSDTSSRSSQWTLRNPPTSPTATTLAATNLLASTRAAPPCSCTALVSQLNPSPRDMSALIAGLSQGIVDAQAKAPATGTETTCHPNEVALALLIVSLSTAQAAKPLDAGTVPQAPELALIQSLAALFVSTPSSVAPPTDITAIPVAVACC
ncbi:hypothetical protein B0H17DRAFT_1213335 [Mycena rosella]|uniref:Uncharacterized protein n=1 Tax=Mycena rosella TaxID=1033263 RepID=A0AAD7CQF7_MYCRO|nr:hypothetical protein B0H17DRAFT_1213335 [Mycena rosella]